MQSQDAERELGELLDSHHGTPGRRFLRKPVEALRALRLLRRLPVLTCAISEETAQGRLIRTYLRRTVLGLSPWPHQANTVLELPDRPEDYSVGHHRATLRRKVRKATEAGVTWREVTDEAERLHLVDLVTDYVQSHPDETYRHLQRDHRHLADIPLWLVAYQDGQPLLISVTAVEGEWALLRYFRTLADTEAASLARYLMTQVVAERLVEEGVRYVCDTISPFRLRPGLRHFSRMVGFRIRRVRVV